MDFDEYVAARYGRLIEHAVLLGCAEGEAGTQVDRVLLEQRRRIRRAEDPDPWVREALERAIGGPPERRSYTGPLVALGLVTVAVLVGVALTYRPAPEPMPSLFALDGAQAEQLLTEQGYKVVLRPARACEPQGLVLGSEPRVGSPLSDGATVTVRTAEPSETFCSRSFADRSDAWAFIAFALGGPAPAFARTVNVVVDGRDYSPLDHTAAEDLDRWGAVMTRVADTARAAAPTDTGMPHLTVLTSIPPRTSCGVPRPPATGDRGALRIEIDARPEDDRTGCPFTIDLYRGSDRTIDGVVIYTAKQGDDEVAEAARALGERVGDRVPS